MPLRKCLRRRKTFWLSCKNATLLSASWAKSFTLTRKRWRGSCRKLSPIVGFPWSTPTRCRGLRGCSATRAIHRQRVGCRTRRLRSAPPKPTDLRLHSRRTYPRPRAQRSSFGALRRWRRLPVCLVTPKARALLRRQARPSGSMVNARGAPSDWDEPLPVARWRKTKCLIEVTV